MPVLLAIVALSIVAILGFQRPWPILAALIFVIAVLAMLAWRALTPAIKAIRLGRDGDMQVELLGETGFIQASPGPGATVHPFLTVIALSTADGRYLNLIAAVR